MGTKEEVLLVVRVSAGGEEGGRARCFSIDSSISGVSILVDDSAAKPRNLLI